MRNLFAEMDRAGEAFRSEQKDKKLLMSDFDYRQWEIWQKGHTFLRYFALPMRGLIQVQDELASMREDSIDGGYFIDAANRLYDELSLSARAGLRVAHLGIDIRHLPPTLDLQGILGDARAAKPYIQQGMDDVVDAGLLPPVTVGFAGHARHEPYYVVAVD